MDKRYQVFVSSTFRDLIEERQAVLKAVLELDHMPAGMELFPASDDSAWELIEDVIDSSDYYVLIIGGRYGSLDETGIGFTEKEYDYAIARGKPVVPLLHKNPDNLPRDKTEIEEVSWNKLKAFRSKVEKKHTCVYWNSSEELKAKVIVGLTATVKRHPAVGWVRADLIPSDATLAEILNLRRRISELEEEISIDRTAPPKGVEELGQGEDVFSFEVNFHADPKMGTVGLSRQNYKTECSVTWNDLFSGIAPTLLNESSDSAVRVSMKGCILALASAILQKNESLKDYNVRHVNVGNDVIDTCIVQFRALGLIRESVRQRSVRDTNSYWTLTPYGDHLMVQLRAVRKVPLQKFGVRAGQFNRLG